MFRQIEQIITQSTSRGGARRAANQTGGITPTNSKSLQENLHPSEAALGASLCQISHI